MFTRNFEVNSGTFLLKKWQEKLKKSFFFLNYYNRIGSLISSTCFNFFLKQSRVVKQSTILLINFNFFFQIGAKPLLLTAICVWVTSFIVIQAINHKLILNRCTRDKKIKQFFFSFGFFANQCKSKLFLKIIIFILKPRNRLNLNHSLRI